MKTQYLIVEDSLQEMDSNGCTPLDYAQPGTILLQSVTARGRKLLAQDVDVMRVIELGEAKIWYRARL